MNLGEKALGGIGQDSPGSLADILNIAHWHSAIGTEGRKEIRLNDLFRGLAFAEKGVAAKMLEGSSMDLLYIPSNCSKAQESDVSSLSRRFKLRFLTALEQRLRGHCGTLWLIENEPSIRILVRRPYDLKERAELFLAWRDTLFRESGEQVLRNAKDMLSHLHAPTRRAFESILYERHKDIFVLSHHTITPSSKLRQVARSYFERCLQYLETAKTKDERLTASYMAQTLAEPAGLYEERERLSLLLLDELSDAYFKNRVTKDLIESYLEQGRLQVAFQWLMKYSESCQRDCERDVIGLGQRLWRLGGRDEFHQVLEQLKNREDPDLLMIEETQTAYRSMEATWTVDEVKSFEPIFLSPL